ncbi:MAG: DUF1549 domain-containing protein [Verrucomicrobiota bacterium]
MRNIHHRPSPLRVAWLLVATLLLTLSVSHARTWTRSSDGKQLDAVFVALGGGNIQLKLANGQIATLPMDTFTKADQEAAERFNVLGDDTQVKKAAQTIDSLLAKKLGEKGFKSFNDPLPDDLFVRRVYLDILGRIPTREEFLEFAESAREDKREALIDELLSQPGYASHLFNYFADMYRLHANDSYGVGVRNEPYLQWWKDSLAANVPYDELVTQMITATGNVGQNPAAGFILRDAGMEFDAFSNFGQVMLGIDVSCAQCHDHPFEVWTMDDFYGMAAFFGSTQRTLKTFRAPGGGMMMSMNGGRSSLPNAPENWIEDFKSYAATKGVDRNNRDGSRWLGNYIDFLAWNVADSDEYELPVPTTIEDVGGKVFRPTTMIGKPAKLGSGTRREAMADWLTDAENPRFALVIANRMWSRAFGRAIIEPVHDFPVDWETGVVQAEVGNYIANVMKGFDYDLRQFMRTLYNTRAYQSIYTYEEPHIAESYPFQGPVLRRMRAEQAWDSLMVLAYGPEVDTIKGRDGSYIRALLNVDFNTVTMPEMFERFESYYANYQRNLGAGIVRQTGQLNPDIPEVPKLGGMELIRASEMSQPARGGHLLDTFGQSDRRVTDEHTYDGTVPQVLALMNGPVTARLTQSGSKVVEELEDLDAPDDKVRAVYFTILSRFPTAEELALGVEILEDYGNAGIGDLTWALMNGPEFLFIQ